MEHREQMLKTAAGTSIYTQEWVPDQAKAAVVLVHGLGEHSGRYAHVAGAFNRAGYAVLAMDLPGHGKTGGPLGHIPSYDLVMNLISQMVEEAKRRYPEKPVFVYGHSMGGNLVLYYGLKCNPEIAGIICTSPGLGTAEPVPAWKTLMGKLLYNMAPTMQMANGLDVTGLSHDQKVIDAYVADPLVHNKISTRLGIDMLSNGAWILAHAGEFPHIPLLLMQGSQDRIVNPALTKQFAEKTSADLTFIMWEGGYHEMHNEPQKAEVIQTMTDWMDRHLG